MAVMVAADVDAPAAVKERLEPFEPQIIIAAEITIESPDFGHLEAVFDAALRNLERSGASDRPAIVVPMPATGTRDRWRASSTRHAGTDPAGLGPEGETPIRIDRRAL